MRLFFKYILVCHLIVNWYMKTIACNENRQDISKRSLVHLPSHVGIGQNDRVMLHPSQAWEFIDFSDDYLRGGISNKCMSHLNAFSAVTSKFIDCAVTNSRPLKYCKNCVSDYVSVENAFEIISDQSSNPKNNCREQILRADTIQLALVTYNFVQKIWESSACIKCFDSSDLKNNSQPSAMTNNMLKKINATLQCFKHYHDNNNNSVCDYCKEDYCAADEYYEKVERQGKLCSDLIDSMNYTRLAWAGEYKCTVALKDRGAIWVITAIVLLLPFILYLGVVFHDKRYAARQRGFEDSYCQDLDGSD